LGTSFKLFWKFFDKTLRRPRACFPKRANRAPGAVVSDTFERFWVFRNTAATQHAVGDFFHPKRTFPAGRALAAALMGIELIDVIECPHHVARIIEHDHAAGTSHRTRCGKG